MLYARYSNVLSILLAAMVAVVENLEEDGTFYLMISSRIYLSLLYYYGIERINDVEQANDDKELKPIRSCERDVPLCGLQIHSRMEKASIS